ncbi:MAG: M20/M25/M40 family metallo-hydrolase [Terriglobia bacterium]
MMLRRWGVTMALLTCLVPPLQAQRSLDAHFRSISWEGYQNRAVELFREYLRIDTSNPPGNELAAAEFFHRLFDAAGIPNTIYTYAPGRANLYAILKGDGSLRPLILLNHTDVVRAEPQNWRLPPFSGDILDGEIYGRGAVDMKDEGLIQAMVMLMAAREHLPRKRDLVFLATADEEVGGTGSQWMIANHAELLRPAEYLITEGGSNLLDSQGRALYGVGVGEKMPCWVRLTARGRGGHGSMPIADSAPNRLVRALQRVVDWESPVRLLPGVEKYFHEVAELQSEPRAEKFRNIRAALRDPSFLKSLTEDEDYNYLLRDTISLTMLRAGEQTNVIPDSAYCELDVRLLPDRGSEEFLRELKRVVADDSIEIQPLSTTRTPNSSPVDTSLYRIIEQVARQLNPKALVAPALNSGYTESQIYRTLGIHCYGFGPVEITPQVDASQHAANERLPAEQIRRGVRLLYEIVARTVNEP